MCLATEMNEKVAMEQPWIWNRLKYTAEAYTAAAAAVDMVPTTELAKLDSLLHKTWPLQQLVDEQEETDDLTNLQLRLSSSNSRSSSRSSSKREKDNDDLFGSASERALAWQMILKPIPQKKKQFRALTHFVDFRYPNSNDAQQQQQQQQQQPSPKTTSGTASNEDASPIRNSYSDSQAGSYLSRTRTPSPATSSTYLYSGGDNFCVSAASSSDMSAARTMSISMSFDDLDSNSDISGSHKRGGIKKNEAWYERRQSYGFEAADKLQSLLNTSNGSSDTRGDLSSSSTRVSRSCDSLGSTVKSTSSNIEKMIPPWIKLSPSAAASNDEYLNCHRGSRANNDLSRSSSRFSYIFGENPMASTDTLNYCETPKENDATVVPASVPAPAKPKPVATPVSVLSVGSERSTALVDSSVRRSDSARDKEKTRSATNLLERTENETEPVWLRDLKIRRSLRDQRSPRLVPRVDEPPKVTTPSWVNVKLRRTGVKLVDDDEAPHQPPNQSGTSFSVSRAASGSRVSEIQSKTSSGEENLVRLPVRSNTESYVNVKCAVSSHDNLNLINSMAKETLKPLRVEPKLFKRASCQSRDSLQSFPPKVFNKPNPPKLSNNSTGNSRDALNKVAPEADKAASASTKTLPSRSRLSPTSLSTTKLDVEVARAYPLTEEKSENTIRIPSQRELMIDMKIAPSLVHTTTVVSPKTLHIVNSNESVDHTNCETASSSNVQRLINKTAIDPCEGPDNVMSNSNQSHLSVGESTVAADRTNPPVGTEPNNLALTLLHSKSIELMKILDGTRLLNLNIAKSDLKPSPASPPQRKGNVQQSDSNETTAVVLESALPISQTASSHTQESPPPQVQGESGHGNDDVISNPSKSVFISPLVETNVAIASEIRPVSSVTSLSECNSAAASIRSSLEDLTQIKRPKKVVFDKDVKEESDRVSRPRRIRSRSPETRLREWQTKLETRSGQREASPEVEYSASGLPLTRFGDLEPEIPKSCLHPSASAVVEGVIGSPATSEVVPNSVPNSVATSETFRFLLQPRKSYALTGRDKTDLITPVDTYPRRIYSTDDSVVPTDPVAPVTVVPIRPAVIVNGIVNFDQSVERKIEILETDSKGPIPKSILKKRSLENLLDERDTEKEVPKQQETSPRSLNTALELARPWKLNLKRVNPPLLSKVSEGESKERPIPWRTEIIRKRPVTVLNSPSCLLECDPSPAPQAVSDKAAELDPPRISPAMKDPAENVSESPEHGSRVPVVMVARCEIKHSRFLRSNTGSSAAAGFLSSESHSSPAGSLEEPTKSDLGYHSLETDNAHASRGETNTGNPKPAAEPKLIHHTIDEAIEKINETIEEIRSVNQVVPTLETVTDSSQQQPTSNHPPSAYSCAPSQTEEPQPRSEAGKHSLPGDSLHLFSQH